MPDILDHIEKTTADNYRKEIDQEENVWRTLPFFVAALSLEVAELTQVKDQLVGLPRLATWTAGGLGLCALFATIVAIFYLYRSIAFAEFKYVTPDPDLVSFGAQIQQAIDAETVDMVTGMTTLKTELARQYAVSTDNNRSINQHRVAMRTAAGIATLVSLLAILLLGAVTVGTHLWLSGAT